MSELKRSLSFSTLSIYGIGTVLGAGIYVLVGEVIGEGGQYAPLAFLVAALVTSFTAMSYGELSSRLPKGGGPSAYADEAFGRVRLTRSADGLSVDRRGLVCALHALSIGITGQSLGSEHVHS